MANDKPQRNVVHAAYRWRTGMNRGELAVHGGSVISLCTTTTAYGDVASRTDDPEAVTCPDCIQGLLYRAEQALQRMC